MGFVEEKVVGGLFVHGGVLCVVVVQGVVVGGEVIQGVVVVVIARYPPAERPFPGKRGPIPSLECFLALLEQ